MEREREPRDEVRDERADEVSAHLLGAPRTAREKRVSHLRALVRSGCYEVDPYAVAEALLRRPVISALIRAR